MTQGAESSLGERQQTGAITFVTGAPEGPLGHSHLGRHFAGEVTFKLSP